MSWLKVYQWEKNEYLKFYDVRIKDEDAIKYLRKFCRHFKTEPILLAVGNKRDGSGYYQEGWHSLMSVRIGYYQTKESGTAKGFIRVCKNPTLAIIVHEFAHHLTASTGGKGHHHDKLFKRSLKKSYTYAKRWLPKAVERGLV